MRFFLAARALFFLVLVPGTVTLYFPSLVLRATGTVTSPVHSLCTFAAMTMILIGFSVLLACVWLFFASGRGTLAPVDPPKRLVVEGLYRFTRNPMYSGVILALAGEAWLFLSADLAYYVLTVFLVVHLFVVLYEEPALDRAFGSSYRAYRAAVPRWTFTLRPYSSNKDGSI
ncbi:MAG: methyltransferase family protein [Gammaproteobacteria bacterium]